MSWFDIFKVIVLIVGVFDALFMIFVPILYAMNITGKNA